MNCAATHREGPAKTIPSKPAMRGPGRKSLSGEELLDTRDALILYLSSMDDEMAKLLEQLGVKLNSLNLKADDIAAIIGLQPRSIRYRKQAVKRKLQSRLAEMACDVS